MQQTTELLTSCTTAVDATFAAVFERIAEWQSHIARLAELEDGIVSTSSLDLLVESIVVPQLELTGALEIGAGFVASPGFLADAEWHLAWWLGHANTFGAGGSAPRIRRLAATEDVSSESFRDYTALEWWRVPASTRSQHITGPYVDYLCTDDYTLTLTMPVAYEGTMIGVVGADLYVREIERVLLPVIRSLGEPATIVNATGRVVVSTDAHRPTGTLVRDLPAVALRTDGGAASDGRRAYACGTSSLVLLVG